MAKLLAQQKSILDYLTRHARDDDDDDDGPHKRLATEEMVAPSSSSSSSPVGSPIALAVPRTFKPSPLSSVQIHVDSYLDQVSRALTNRPFFQPKLKLQRFFLGAVLKIDDNDPGEVFFGFHGDNLQKHLASLKRQSRREFSQVAVAALDGDDPVVSTKNFLRPFGLDATHHWSLEFRDYLDIYLVARWAHVHGVNKQCATDELRAHFLLSAEGIRTVCAGGVWFKAK